MKIFLTGATGFLGSQLAHRLERQSDMSICYMIRNNLLGFSAESIMLGVIDANTQYSFALNQVDVVIHCAALAHVNKTERVTALSEYRIVNVEGTENLARQAAVAGVKRFIFISSIGVSGINSLFPFTEKDAPSPHDSYSKSKFEAEVVLKKISLETGMEVVIIRPPLVYGGNAPGNFGSLIKLLAKPIPLPFGAVENKRSMVYVGNLVDFIILCIDHPNAANETFLISDGEDLSLKSLITYIRKAMGKSAWLIPVPTSLFKLVGTLTGKSGVVNRLVGDLQVDSSKACELLEWKPPYSIEKGISETILDFNNRKN